MVNEKLKRSDGTQLTNKGFTLIELLISLAVLAILVSLTAPSFRDFMRDTRMGSITGDLVTLVKFARAEAIRTGKRVYITPINSPGAANEWGNGIRVWIDTDADGSFDSDEELRALDLLTGDTTVDVASASDSFDFTPRGTTRLTSNLVVNICDARKGETGRQISILNSGLVTVNHAFSCL